jgi:hypothetical protein
VKHRSYRKAIFFVLAFVCVLTVFLSNGFVSKTMPKTAEQKMMGIHLVENFKLVHSDKKRPFRFDDQFFFYKYTDDYNLLASLRKIKYLGANTVVLVTSCWVEKLSSYEILFDRSVKADMIAVVRRAHKLGLKVILKPLIQVRESKKELEYLNEQEWRGRIEPKNAAGNLKWKEWFESYQKFLDFHLEIAAESPVEMLVVGSELVTATASKPDLWVKLLLYLRDAIKTSGKKLKLAYNPEGLQETNQILSMAALQRKEYLDFLGHLDFLMPSIYADFSKKRSYIPTKKQLLASLNAFLFRIDAYFKRARIGYKKAYGRPLDLALAVGEFGLKSADDALFHSWEHPDDNDVDDPVVQDYGYRQFFKAVRGIEWLQGVLLWNLYMDPYYGIENFPNRDSIRNGTHTFSINGKPAEQTVASGFSKMSGSLFSQKNIEYHFVWAT